ncbi:MAG: nucleotidyltransferase family protein [Gemmatimonadota bacterium]|nr:nucleotidyltransferase family protein [Gemmatimonadota bacterium]
MTQRQRGDRPRREMAHLSREEQKSVTHGDFWIPEGEREIYKRILHALNAAGIPYVVAGAYAIHAHTGIYRETKDLDVFVEPDQLVPAMRALKAAAFTTRLEQPHWLAKAISGDHFCDIIYGMGNGLALIDHDWYRHSRPAILAATPVRVAPAEELLWHRLFINERHRHDMADILHLIMVVGARLDWHRILDRTGIHWPLLLAQLQLFDYVYPEARERVPRWLSEELLSRAAAALDRERTDEPYTRGTIISRFSFNIDVAEWSFRDSRTDLIEQTESQPVIRDLVAADVWDERSPMTLEYEERYGERVE